MSNYFRDTTLGVPTVADRIAQTVVRGYLEPDVEPVFHEDSYGYRPGRSALDAVGVCRERCWRQDWVLDLDLKSFFYCKDADRRGSHGHESFTFLGYTFRPRLARSKRGNLFVSFLPAIGNDERKRIGRVIRRWRLHRRSGSTLTDLAEAINAEVRGWINYYGRFYRSELNRLLRRINEYLVRWARWKYKRLRRYPAKARRLLAAVYRREPDLFAHWRFGVRPDGWTMGAG